MTAANDTAGTTSTSSEGLSGTAQAATAAAGDYANKAKEFAKARPWASAALAGVLGMALLNTLRGKGGKAR